ncbi:MAG: hypothetical protein JXA42_01255 [Anaerolineales bacterium]|nr:hypothetical protein [Anaerolineales bacterium]
MLKNVLGVYLDNVKEREFDLPFLTLLRSQDFVDIHFTHGNTEFGKDFIAKRNDDGEICQYTFQVKVGNIGQASWRNDIQGQVLEALLSGLSHPNFDRSICHKSCLVVTGILKGNAPLGMQNLNQKIVDVYKLHPIILWDRDYIINMLGSFGLEEFYASTSFGYVGYGDFYVLYGKSLSGYISENEIEEHSRCWLSNTIEDKNRILGITLESEIISQNCFNNGYYYEGIQAQLAAIRFFLQEINSSIDTSKQERMLTILDQAIINLRKKCLFFVNDVYEQLNSAERDLVRLITGPGFFYTYLVFCARILEIAGFAFFLVLDGVEKRMIINFIHELISTEPGCTHIPSDKYAISLVFPVLALMSYGMEDDACDVVKQVTIWLCDRYEKGDGLAHFEATPNEEITTLFGYPYDFVDYHKYGDSFLATVLSDLAAFIGNQELYMNIVNDLQASGVFPTYWQISDERDLFFIDAGSIISYPAVRFYYNLDEFSNYKYAEHIIHELKSFKLNDSVNSVIIMSTVLLLRDRYFPTLWKKLCEAL